MKIQFYIVLVLVLTFTGCKEDTSVHTPAKEVSFKILPSKSQYVAGEMIKIQFQGEKTKNCFLWVSNAFGGTMLVPDFKEGKLIFTLPKSFSEKSGSCYWRLVNGQNIAFEGEVSIVPNIKKDITMESFLGPKRISAGGTDFSMLVTAPTDSYDNLLSDSTEINLGYQFKNNIDKATIYLKNGIGWKNLYSSNASGRMLITASYKSQSSKEMTAIVHSANAIDFKINYNRNHTYADGNQVITFFTDRIKDNFGNTVSDGTLVTFSVKNAEGALLKTNGTTINGIAKASLLHPDKPENWFVTAYVTGAAKSKTLSIGFKQAMKNFSISYADNGRTVHIHHMQSFMGQLVPDGIPVVLEIQNEKGILLETMRATSRLGNTRFMLSKDFYAKGLYELRLKAAGIVKTDTVILQ